MEASPASSEPSPSPLPRDEKAVPDVVASGDDDGDVYELAEIEDEPPASGVDALAADPRAAGALEEDAADTDTASAPPSAAVAPDAGPVDRPRPAIHSTEEPKYVDPEVAARRREEARARAAEQMAIEHARRTKRNLILAGVALVIVAIIALLWKF